MKECEDKTIMIGFEPMQSFIESMYESLLDALNIINISALEFGNSCMCEIVDLKDKHSQTKGE